jgi:hypothetical protein
MIIRNRGRSKRDCAVDRTAVGRYRVGLPECPAYRRGSSTGKCPCQGRGSGYQTGTRLAGIERLEQGARLARETHEFRGITIKPNTERSGQVHVDNTLGGLLVIRKARPNEQSKRQKQKDDTEPPE